MKNRRFLYAIILYIALCLPFSVSAQFTVRTIYFQPADVNDAEMPERIRDTMEDVQTFYANEMKRHGYGDKTFRVEKNANNKIVVHVVQGAKKTEEYISDKTYAAIKQELPEKFANLNNIHVIFVGGHSRVNRTLLGIGVATFGSVDGGVALLPTDNFIFRVIVHEIGHTFGLQHNIADTPDYLMGFDSGFDGLAKYEARWLDKHHYFNPVRPINFIPKITKVHATERLPNNKLRFRMDVESINNLHQAEIARFNDIGVLATDFLKGDLKETASFEFPIRSLMGNKSVWMRIIDQRGNYWMQHTPIHVPLPSNKNPDITDEREGDDTDDLENIAEPEDKGETPPSEEKDPLRINAKHKRISLWASMKRR